MTKEQLKNEIVKLVCEKGKGLSLYDAAHAISEAVDHFLENTKIVDGMFAPKNE